MARLFHALGPTHDDEAETRSRWEDEWHGVKHPPVAPPTYPRSGPCPHCGDPIGGYRKGWPCITCKKVDA